ncbi:hypothetical protein ERJ75_000747800 [Trypanosoma vivax]|uniref:Uncharacterized protein n=1 Tax=Trypanosoma vivax (strain Y486) TaxID=1055687 RepID=G0U096_TRYVY|nr:hypothetical protein TRVL_03000 [Trypanosoma vivax]KAH8613726.1 hypothetical protein ERJ75_000747800 [Trypanosoma vivax]CCC49494.1 conserved hypothetical protein [Trypanosoma vivax Y486]
MLRCGFACYIRVLGLTMIPDGGALAMALRRLGYKPYTLRDSFKHGHATRHPAEWVAALHEGKAVDFNKMLVDYDAVVGPPAVLLYEEILRGCPDYTKVILVSETDKQQWANDYQRYVVPLLKDARPSSRNRVAKALHAMISEMILKPIPDEPGRAASGGDCQRDVVSRQAGALELFEAEVQLKVPPNRLLVHCHKDGWGPICKFLGKEVPCESYPPLDNGMHVIRNLVERIERTEKLTLLLVLGALCGAVYLSYPLLASVDGSVRKLYRDYQTAYGSS